MSTGKEAKASNSDRVASGDHEGYNLAFRATVTDWGVLKLYFDELTAADVTCAYQDGHYLVTFPHKEAAEKVIEKKCFVIEDQEVTLVPEEESLQALRNAISQEASGNSVIPLTDKRDDTGTLSAVSADASDTRDAANVEVVLIWPESARDIMNEHQSRLHELLRATDCNVQWESEGVSLQWLSSDKETVRDKITRATKIIQSHLNDTAACKVLFPIRADKRLQLTDLQKTHQNLQFRPGKRFEDLMVCDVVGRDNLVTDFISEVATLISESVTEELVLRETDFEYFQIMSSSFNSSQCVLTIKPPNILVVSGQPAKVCSMLRDIFSALINKKKAVFSCNTLTRSCMKKKWFTEHLRTYLNGISAVVQVKDTKVVVYAQSKDDAQGAVGILQDKIVIKPVPLPAEALTLVHTWEPKMESFCDHKALVIFDQERKQYSVIGWIDHVHDVIDTITTFVQDMTPLTRTFPAENALVAYLSTFMKQTLTSDVDKINAAGTGCPLQVSYESTGFVLTGNVDRLQKGVNLLKERLKDIRGEVFDLETGPMATSLLEDHLLSLEEQTQTIIRIKGCSTKEFCQTTEGRSLTCRNAVTRSLETSDSVGSDIFYDDGQQGSRIKVYSIVSSLSDVKVDVLVNSVHQSLDLSKGVMSSSVADAAGPGLQEELYANYSDGIIAYSYVVSLPHNLPCKAVIHVACANYYGEYSEERLLKLFCSCLDKAESLGARSIAFPAVGSGGHGYPLEVVFRKLVEAVDAFRSKHPTSTINSVICAILDDPTAARFTAILRGHQGGILSAREQTATTNSVSLPPAVSQAAVRYSAVAAAKPLPFHAKITKDVTLNIVCGGIPEEERHVELLFRGPRAFESDAKEPSSNLHGYVRVSRKVIQSASHVGQLTAALWKAKELNAKSISISTKDADETNVAVFAQTIMAAVLDYAAYVDGPGFATIWINVEKESLLPCFCDSAFNALNPPLQKLKLGGVLKAAVALVVGRQPQSAPPKTITPHDAYLTTVEIYGTGRASIDLARRAIRDYPNFKLVEQTMPSEFLRDLTEDEMKHLLAIGGQSNTSITIHKEQGVFVARGYSEANVVNACRAINVYLLRMAHERKSKALLEQRKQMALTMLEVFQWQYQDPTGKWFNLDSLSNMNLEDAIKTKKPCSLEMGSYGSVLSFDPREPTIVRHVGAHDRVCYPLRRIDMVKWKGFPKEWELCDHYCEVVLTQGSEEFSSIESTFLNNAGASAEQVTEIKRIQDPVLWWQFQGLKDKVNLNMDKAKQLMGSYLRERTLWDVPCSRQLWHGSSESVVSQIVKDGRFNRQYAGDAVPYGKGVYFARDASYAAQAQYAKKGVGGTRQIILAEVITGYFAKGEPGMIVPPRWPGSDLDNFDSTVDDESDPSIFVVYHDAQAYPLYVVTFV